MPNFMYSTQSEILAGLGIKINYYTLSNVDRTTFEVVLFKSPLRRYPQCGRIINAITMKLKVHWTSG
jgi:hypothetical protein